MILLINAFIFSHLNCSSSIRGKCSEKLKYEVQKCIIFAAKVASNGRYWKRDLVTHMLKHLKWTNFNSVLQLKEASVMYENLHGSADSNAKKINFDLRYKVSLRITRNGTDLHIDYRKTAIGEKEISVSKQSCGIQSRWIYEIQIPSQRSKIICTNTSSTPNNHNMGILHNRLNNIQNFVIFFRQSVVSQRRETHPNTNQ